MAISSNSGNTISTSAKQAAARRNKLVGKPKRPLSAYNIFFQEERKLMVHEALAKSTNGVVTQDMINDALKPGRRKPRHHRTHGMVPFKVLTSRVSTKWRSLSSEKKSVFEVRANDEIKRYEQEVSKWRTEREIKMAEQIVHKIVESEEDEKSTGPSSCSTSTAAFHQAPASVQPQLPMISILPPPVEKLTPSISSNVNLNMMMVGDTSKAFRFVTPPLKYLSVAPQQQAFNFALPSTSMNNNTFIASPSTSPEPCSMEYSSNVHGSPPSCPFQINASMETNTSKEPPFVMDNHLSEEEGSLGMSQTVHLLSNLGNLASSFDDDCLNMLLELSK